MDNKDIDYTALDYSLFKKSYIQALHEGSESQRLGAEADKIGAQAAKIEIDDHKKALQALKIEKGVAKDSKRRQAIDLKIKQKELLIKKAEAEQEGT